VLANRVLAAAGAIFSWAIREELLDLPANPCRGVERSPTRSRSRVLQDSELRALWPALNSRGLVRATALWVLLLTGQRPGEVLRLRWELIVDGWWHLPGAPDEARAWPGTKNGHDHRVRLSEPLRALLSELETDGREGLVFPNPRGRPYSILGDDMRRLCGELNPEPRVTPHDLRRTHGATITRLGLGREAMNRIQNHLDGGIGSVYDRHS